MPRAVRALVAAAILLLAACASRRASPPPAATAAAAERGWARQAFAVQDHGRLLLSLPPGWTATEGERGEAGAPAIRIDGRGGAFTALLTPLWNPGGGEEDLADTARLFADVARHAALSGSVEREIPLEELSGPGVKGFWFAATDRELVGRAPAPDEWRHIVQGAAAVGPVLLAFTLLDNGPGAQRGELLEVVRSARHAEGGEDDATAEEEPVPEGRTVPLRVAWPGKSWAVLVDLPGFTAGARRAGEGRGPFVLGVHPATGIVASVALLPAGEAADADGCREQALAAIAAAIPDLADLRRADAARGSQAASRASYTVTGSEDGGVVQQNVHAFLHREGLCANVHVSKANPEPGDREAIEAILATVRFGEEL